MANPKTYKIISLILILNLSLIFLPSFLSFKASAAEENTLKKVLVLYDRRNVPGFDRDEVASIVNLFYHFKVEIDEISVSSYKKGILQNYDYVVYIGIEHKDIAKTLLADLIEYQNPLLFIGRGIKPLIEEKYFRDLAFEKEAKNPVSVTYKDKNFTLDIPSLFQKINLKNKNNKIFSTLNDDQNDYPYILTSSNLWYVSCLNTQGVLFYILADVLHDFFQENHLPKQEIYLRLEDVHSQRPLDNLYAIADYLKKENIPYIIALIPSFYDVETKKIYPIQENKKFVRALRYMQKSGGSIILHGYTHQIHEDMPGEGFEFWDGVKNSPLETDMKKWVDQRVGTAIDECVDAGIYPLGFEAPHYAVSQEGYLYLKDYFSTLLGHLQTSDLGFNTTTYPYRLYNAPLYNQLLPENLGYVDPNDVYYVQHILEKLDEVSVVRDYTAGFYFHSYLDISLLQPVIEELKKENVQFIDLKSEDNWVKNESYFIQSQNGKIKVEDLKKEGIFSVSCFSKIIYGAVLIFLVIAGLLRVRKRCLKQQK